METCFTDTTIRDKTKTEDSQLCKCGQLETQPRRKEVNWHVKKSKWDICFFQSVWFKMRQDRLGVDMGQSANSTPTESNAMLIVL